MNGVPFEQQQYHPIRYMTMMGACISDDTTRFDEVANQLQELSENYLGTSRVRPDSLLRRADFPYSSSDGWEEYSEEIFDSALKFFREGQNIFHIRRELVSMLTKTDVKKVRIDDIMSPFDFCYIHFGGAGPELWGSYHLDGSYIWSFIDEDEHSIGLCHIGSNQSGGYPEGSSPKIVFEDKIHIFHLLVYEEPSFQTVEDFLDWDFRDDSHGSELYQENRKRWKPHLDEVIPLVVNTLLFLTARPGDVSKRYHSNAPQNLVDKTKRAEERGDQSTKKRSEAKLLSHGHKRINFVGDKVASALQKGAGSEDSPKTHWRRGHWRRQAHGPNYSQHKLIWIEPTLVGTENPESVETKHIYDVEDE